MLAITIAVPAIQSIIWFYQLNLQFELLLHVISSYFYEWMGCGWPLVVSYFISRKLKCPASSAILFLSTIGYGIFYIYAMYAVLTPGSDGMVILVLYFLGLMSLPIMLPVWITVLVMSAYYARQVTANLETPVHFREKNDQ